MEVWQLQVQNFSYYGWEQCPKNRRHRRDDSPRSLKLNTFGPAAATRTEHVSSSTTVRWIEPQEYDADIVTSGK